MIPEAQDQVPFRGNDAIADNVATVMLVRSVLIAVQLDDELGAMFGKIGKIAADRDLPPEMEAVPIEVTELPPK